MKFLDLARIYVRSGNGGAGCISFRREKYIEFGGPDGGTGGKGGSVRAMAVDGLNTLIDFRFQQHYFAENGRPGMGRNKTGRNGEDIVLQVPVGTEILAEDRKVVIADLIRPNDEVELLRGGNGGFGNVHFKSSRNQAPRHSNPGQLGVDRTFWLRLKLIADVGIVGCPNSGKSTFLSAASNARPKAASYPFTTLHPNLGMANVGGAEFVLADIPGLIRGAHRGLGIGDRFLGHIERCAVLLHLVDGTSRTVVEDYETVLQEIQAYNATLIKKPRVVVLNKVDALTQDQCRIAVKQLEATSGRPVRIVSGVSGYGVVSIIRALNKEIENNREKTQRAEDAVPWHP